MYAGAVKLPEMRRIGVFVQVLINDIAQLLPEGRAGACRRHRIKPAASTLSKIRVVALGDCRKLDTPRTSRSWNTLGRSRVDVYQELALVVTIIEQFDHEGRVPGHGEMIFGQ